MRIKQIIFLINLICLSVADHINQDDSAYQWQQILQEYRNKTLNSIMFKNSDTQARQFWKLIYDKQQLGSIIQQNIQMLLDKRIFYFRIPYHLSQQTQFQNIDDNLIVRITVKVERIQTLWVPKIIRTVPRVSIANQDGYVNSY